MREKMERDSEERETERETKQSNIRLNECVCMCVEIEGVVCMCLRVSPAAHAQVCLSVSSLRLLECQESSLYYLLIQIQSNSCAEQERDCVNM